MRVRHVEGEYRIVLSEEAMKVLRLAEGAEVEVKPVAAAAEPVFRVASTEEVLKAFYETLPQHEHAYRELAK